MSIQDLKNCPNPEQLSEYVAGNLAIESHETIDEHLDRCEECLATVETIDERLESPLSQLLKIDSSTGVTDETIDRELDDLIQRAKQLDQRVSEPAGKPTDQSAKLKVGSVLGNYQLLELIGTGGMGNVYRAKHLRMNRDVALKLISDQRLNSRETKGRFQREVESAAKLTHPNIVAAYDADEAGDQQFLAMEYVDGQNLSELVKDDGPLPFDLVSEILLQAAKGLAYAHSCGIIHRDVKPANLLLDRNGVVKVLDMGLATAPLRLSGEQADSELTTSQSLMGTAAFMAPEQAADPRAVDRRADIYSLGCTVYYLLTGETMFDGSSVMEMIFQHRDQPAPNLQDRCEQCSDQFAAIFQRMIAKSPTDRFSSFDELIGQLEGNSNQVPIETLSARRGSLGQLIPLLALAAVVIGLAFWLPTLFSESNGDGNFASNPRAPDGTGKVVIPGKQSTQHTLVEAHVPIEMVKLEPGKFWMGAHPNHKNADQASRPRHEVTLTKPFELGKFEITRGQFKQVMDTDGPAQAKEDRDVPISGLSWLEAIEFCNRLSQKNGLTPYYKITSQNETTQVVVNGGDGYRLPTEAEWEYASRAGSESIWEFGDDPQQLEQFAWFAKNAVGVPKPVGTRMPNAFGLFDMYGNVPEWCWDRYDPEYYAKSAAIDPTGSTQGFSRVFRGGSARDARAQISSSSRNALAFGYGRLDQVGLRVARTIDQ